MDASLSAAVQKVMEGTLEVLLRGVAAPLLAKELEGSLSAPDVRDGALKAGCEVLRHGVAAPLLAEELEASLSVPDVRECALDAGLEALACGKLRPREAPFLCRPARLLPALRLGEGSVRPAQVASHACRGVHYLVSTTSCTPLAYLCEEIHSILRNTNKAVAHRACPSQSAWRTYRCWSCQ